MGNFELKRALVPRESRPFLSFASNDYLGLARHPQVLEAVRQALSSEGWGSTGSRLLSGDRIVFHQLEQALASFKFKTSALVFGSGYAMNVGVVPAVVGPKDVIFADRLIHASLIDGCRLSVAKLFRFRHNDMRHLEQLLSKRADYDRALIIVESVYSMDGDRAPLTDLVDLKHQYDAQLMVDEAHALGVFGTNGEGLVGEDLAPEVDFVLGTMGKALGSVGGFVACSEFGRAHFIQTVRSLIFSTALPAVTAHASLQALDLLRQEARGPYVLSLAQRLRKGLLSKNYNVLGDTHIVPVVIGDEAEAYRLSQLLAQQGIDAPSVRYPTVPKGESRLRLCVTYTHTDQDIDCLIKLFP